jgi:CRISPR-associated protein Csm3
LEPLQGDKRIECENILKLFGCGADEERSKEIKLGPTRVSFADCSLNKKWKKDASAKMLPLVEVKSENRINRISGTARDPRFIERVPSETKFDFCITLKKMGEEPELETLLLKGLKLLSMDYLGGSGSRGYGRIEFQFNDQNITDKFDQIDPFGE